MPQNQETRNEFIYIIARPFSKTTHHHIHTLQGERREARGETREERGERREAREGHAEGKDALGMDWEGKAQEEVKRRRKRGEERTQTDTQRDTQTHRPQERGTGQTEERCERAYGLQPTRATLQVEAEGWR
eukprot:763129-Hanusia_phi.AAC.2